MNATAPRAPGSGWHVALAAVPLFAVWVHQAWVSEDAHITLRTLEQLAWRRLPCRPRAPRPGRGEQPRRGLGPGLVIVDPYALADPLLARLRAILGLQAGMYDDLLLEYRARGRRRVE